MGSIVCVVIVLIIILLKYIYSFQNTGGSYSYQLPPHHTGKFRPKLAATNPAIAQFVSPDVKMVRKNIEGCCRRSVDGKVG